MEKSIEMELTEKREALKASEKNLDLKIQSLELWMGMNLGSVPIHFDLPAKNGKQQSIAFEQYRRRYHLVLIERYVWDGKEREKKYLVSSLHAEDKVQILNLFLPDLLKQAIETMGQKVQERESLIGRIDSFFEEVIPSEVQELETKAEHWERSEESPISRAKKCADIPVISL